MLKRLSIRQKQTFVILATSSVALLLAGAAFVAYELVSFRDAMTDNLLSLASVIGNNSTAALTFRDPATANELLDSLTTEKHIVAGCVYDNEGRVFASYTREERPFTFPVAARDERHEFTKTHLELFRRIDLKGQRIGTIYLRCDLQELSIRLRQYTVIMATVLCASIIVAFIVSFRLQRLISDPILGLAQVAKVVSADRDYSVRVAKHSEDEVGQLIDGFNEMLGQIQQRDAALQAAHDTLERRVQERTVELEQEVSDRRRAEVGLKQQLTRICLLHSITRAIADRQDLESVVQVVSHQLEVHLPIDFGRVYLFDPETQVITMAAPVSRGTSSVAKTEFFAFATPISQTGLGPCCAGETVVFMDVASGHSQIESRLRESGLHSAVAIPLMVENELFGILLAARKQPASFSSGETEFLRMLGEHVALAAHQARLHAQLQSAYDELRQTQAAVMQQERLRALGQMASGIAHDINNALCPVVVYSDLLLQQPNFDEATLRNLQNIKTAGEDIAHIVSRMREFYRQREKNEALGPVSLNKTAVQVADLTRPRWRDIPQAHGIVIELKTELDAHLPDITGSESELREALTNVILNAVDAMPEGGKLTIRTYARGRDRLTGAPTHAVLELSDNGIGMDEETRRRCLEPFFSTKGRRGTGLGLAMVYGIVERHEGRVEINSSLGWGTTVRLIFPARAVGEATRVAPTQGPVRLPALRVLAIDDEPLLREMLKQILENGGHTVEVADSGQAGLAMFRAAVRRGTSFDVVITDLGMPHLDGRQLSQTLKRESPDTPIIMLTGWGTMIKEDGDVPTQVDAVLSKPPKISELYAMLAKLTNKATPRSQAAA